MIRKLALLALLLSGLLLLGVPAWSQEDAAASEDAEAAAEDLEAAVEEYPENTFRLYSRRNVGFRAGPNVGLRLPPLVPIFSPRTADYYGRDRVYETPLSSVAASFTFLGVDGERDSAKAQEFRDLDEDGAVGIDAQLRTEAVWFRLTGRHLLLDDQDARLELRRFGAFSASLDYNQIPHNYAFDATSIFSGIGTGTLTIDDDVQSTLQGSTDQVDAAARLREIVATRSSRADLHHRRDRLAFELDLTAFDPLAVELVAKREKREGTRPWSASFGLTNVVEIPWPVDYETNDVQLQAEYRKGKTLLSGQYRVSEFDNRISTVRFDNPWRIDDTGVSNSVVSTFENGPSQGLIDLYPSNEQHEFLFTFIRNQLPGKSNLFVTASWGRMEQDDELVPYTVNTAIVPGLPGSQPFDASDPANRPAASADARFDTRLLHVRWTSRPSDAVSFKAEYRDYELENETARIFIPGFVIEDAYWRPVGTAEPGAFTNLPIAEARTEYGFDLAFHFGRSKLTLGYESEDVDREFREVESSTEDRFEVTFDHKPAAWMDLRISYLAAERDAEEYDFAQFFRNQGIDFIPVLSFLRKFDQADRDRDRLQLMVNFFPNDKLTVGGQAIVGEDDYPESRFGVLGEEHQVYAVDFTYAASERVSLFGSYSFEDYEVRIAGREWFPFGPGDPFRVEPGLESASNWSADTTDEIDSISFGVDLQLVPDKLHLDVAYTWSRSDGKIVYSSPVGELDNNPFRLADLTEVDDVTWSSLRPELEYSVAERWSLTFAYMRERYEILDFNNQGFELVPVTPEGAHNGALFMGTFPFDFDLDVFYLTLNVEF